MNKDRDWTVLIIGGASGTGKSSIAYELAQYYSINVMEADDIHQIIKATTTVNKFPMVHYWSTGVNWMDIGVEGNKNWLIDVSKEMLPGIKAVVDRHIEDKLPVIIEGDFIHPELTLSLTNPGVKFIYVHEPDKNQLLKNYFSREGGDLQHYRADVSIEYGIWLLNNCKKLGIKTVESRPWKTLLNRVVEIL